jgi:hypothetical protein
LLRAEGSHLDHSMRGRATLSPSPVPLPPS